MSASTGTTTITCCMPPRASLGRSFGRTCTCCSGCRCFHLLPAGWGESFQRTTHRTLRRGAADGRHRVLPPPAGDHPLAGTGLDFEKGGWTGLEGQALACAVYRCDCCYLACAMDLRGDFRGRCADLVHSRPANRKGSGTEGRLRSPRIRGG